MKGKIESNPFSPESFLAQQIYEYTHQILYTTVAMRITNDSQTNTSPQNKHTQALFWY